MEEVVSSNLTRSTKTFQRPWGPFRTHNSVIGVRLGSKLRTPSAWLADSGKNRNRLFTNARSGPLSRDGVAYILQQAVKRALPSCPSLAIERISPHILRHTTAMHLLQSGVDISVIALWLDHESLETTHISIEADLKMKQHPRKGRTCRPSLPPLQPIRRFAGLPLGTLIMPRSTGCVSCYGDVPSFCPA
jgi:hypothetical protein